MKWRGGRGIGGEGEGAHRADWTRRGMAGRYMQFSPSAGGSPQVGIRSSSAAAEHDKYVANFSIRIASSPGLSERVSRSWTHGFNLTIRLDFGSCLCMVWCGFTPFSPIFVSVVCLHLVFSDRNRSHYDVRRGERGPMNHIHVQFWFSDGRFRLPFTNSATHV